MSLIPWRRRSEPAGELRELVAAAYRAFDDDDWGAAVDLLARVVATGRDERVPGDVLAGWAFDLALAHKFRRDWPAAVAAGRQAAELAPPGEEEPVWWNLGIAATAVRDWPLARLAWQRYGLSLPPGDGPVLADLGVTPVRLQTRAGAEVVWCRRLDPARGRVESVPVEGSGRRWGEIVLHDGVPSGERVVDGDSYPVFDEIELWEPSAVPVQAVDLRVAGPEDVAALAELAGSAGAAAESWDTVRHLCAACSEGTAEGAGGPGHEHGTDEKAGRCRVGIAASAELAGELLARWIRAAPAHRGASTPQTVA
jgi:hypothetical protein